MLFSIYSVSSGIQICHERVSDAEIVDPSISLKPELCLCQKPKKACRRVVLGSSDKKIEIRRHCVEQRDGSGLHDWDIARIRWPRHAEYRTLEVIKKKYLCLDFPSVLGRASVLVARETGVLIRYRKG